MPSFKRSPESEIFSAVYRVLKEDPEIVRNGVNVVRLKDGPATAPGVPMEYPDVSDMPMLRVRVGDYRSESWTERGHKGDLTVNFELFLAGLDEEELFDFWHAVRLALFPDDQGRRAVVDQATSHDKLLIGKLSQQASTFQTIGDSLHGIAAVASLQLKTFTS